MNHHIKWWSERCYEWSYYIMLWTMLGMILLDDAMNDPVEIPKWIQIPTFPTLLDDAMNYAGTMQERCWANTKEYNYGFTLHGTMLWTMLERCWANPTRIQLRTFTLHGTMLWTMLERCSNDAGQIPKNTITHTSLNDAMNDAWTMLGKSQRIQLRTFTLYGTMLEWC